jgi:hypothetical protein
MPDSPPRECNRILFSTRESHPFAVDKLNVKIGPSDYVLRYSVGARRPIPEVASAEYDAIIDMVIAAHR